MNMLERSKFQLILRLVCAASIAGMIAFVFIYNPAIANALQDSRDNTSVSKHDSDRFKQLALKILDTSHSPYSLQPEVAGLAQLLDDCATVRINPSQDISNGETRTQDGLALSPVMAAMCVQDFVRTVVFMRGLYTAIQDSRNRSLDRPTRVLYVGCGPYAVLAIPSMAVFTHQEVEFTLLDIHAPSIDSARSVVNTLGLEKYVTSFETVDAKRYQVPQDKTPDITVMEIMNAALEKEPQVAITRHLLSQAPGTTFVPESVRVDGYLVDLFREFTFIDPQGTTDQPGRDRVFLGTVFELSRETVTSWKNEGNERLPAASIQMPDPLDDRYAPMLFTIIQVYKDHYLKNYDSGLTMPRSMPTDRSLRGGAVLQFQYRLGSHPGLVCE